MKKKALAKRQHFSPQKDLKNVELSTQHTDDSGSFNESDSFPDIEEGLQQI